jgi:hypothetical protein
MSHMNLLINEEIPSPVEFSQPSRKHTTNIYEGLVS